MTPHRSHRLTRALAIGLAGGALAAPAAVARPAVEWQPPVAGSSGAPVAAEPVSYPAGEPLVQTVDEGFDWGSAAIGAGGAGALIVVVSLSGFALTHGGMRTARMRH